MEGIGREIMKARFDMVDRLLKLGGITNMTNIGYSNFLKRRVKLTLDYRRCMIEQAKIGTQGKVKHTQI